MTEHFETPPVRGTVLAGLATVTLFFGGFGTWAVLAPISSASVADGVIAAHGNRRTVQHKEGGIIETLLVRNGDQVEAGDVLVRLDVTQARAEVTALAHERRSLMATEARLEALRDDAKEVHYPNALADAHAITAAQNAIFRASRGALFGQIELLEQRIGQSRARITGAGEREDSLVEQIALIDEEIGRIGSLVERGLVARSRMTELQTRRVELDGRLGETLAQITEAETSIDESRMSMLTLREQTAEKTASELDETRRRLSDVEKSLATAKDVLARNEITAPVAGTIVNARYFTKGGVVAPGQPVMDIVPRDERLIVKARIDPLDIDIVREGLPAEITLTAYRMRTTPTLAGEVTGISADIIVSEDGTQSYFEANVEIDTEVLNAHPEIDLYPGMPAQVMVQTGERTLAAYLLDPIYANLNLAFRES